MRRIIHNTTAIVACLSLMAPHVAMAQTHTPEHAAQKHANEKTGLVLAQADEQPLPPDAAEQTEEPPAETEAPAPVEAEAPAGEAETAAPVEAETEAPAEIEAEPDEAVEAETPEPVEPEAPAAVEADSEAPAEAETVAPTETEAEAPAETETPAEAPTEAEAPEEAAPADVEAPAEAEAPAPTEAEAETPAEADAETTEPAAPVKKPAATENEPEQTGGQDVGDASDGAAPEDEDALAEALAKEDKASDEDVDQNDPAAPEQSEATDEDGLADALAEQEEATEEAEQQPADTEGAEQADDAAENGSTTEESAAEESSETEPATETSAEAEIPADLSALSAEDGEGEVTEETVTEENSRSSSEDFTTNLNDALSGAAGQETQQPDDDDDNNALAKAALLGLGGLAIGAMLSNNREVELSTPDRLVVTHADGSQEVIKDETALLRQPGSTVTTENFEDGSSRTTVTRADGSKVVTIRDGDLRVLRRSLVSADGNSMALIDDTAAAIPVDISSLPAPAEPVQTTDGSLNEEELRAALLQEVNVGRQFTLGQIRNISEVRALVAPINIDAITFDTGSAAIKADQAKQLSTLGKVIQQAIQENPQEIFLIEGHTDTVGDAAMNLALSDRRAESVALALTEYFDVQPENLVTQGYGEQFPKVEAEGDNRDNRRASVRRITDLLQTASTE